MRMRQVGLATAAGLLLATVALATVALATAQDQAPGSWKERPWGSGDLSPEVRARLHDGRMAMIKGALRFDEAQLKLWAPVEAELRVTLTARQRTLAARRETRRDAGHLSLADRLDRRSQRMTERAQRAKALAEAFRPFYASLSDEQKALASFLLRPVLGGFRLRGRHWFRRRASGAEQR